MTSLGLTLLPAWVISWHLMSAITACSPCPACLTQAAALTLDQDPMGMQELTLGELAVAQGSNTSS